MGFWSNYSVVSVGRIRRGAMLSALGFGLTVAGLVGLPGQGRLAMPGARAQVEAVVPLSRRTVFVLHSPLAAPLSEPSIAERFNAAGLDYELIRWSELGEISGGGDRTSHESPILFLPSAEVVTPEQISALSRFLDQGGQLIVSGRIGLASPTSIQQELRSLLGAYWAFPLMQPAQVAPVAEGEPVDDSSIMGGTVVPSHADSQVLATWRYSSRTDGPRNAAAVVQTGQVIFLGWDWGETSGPQMDSAWLQAAVLQYDGRFATGGQVAGGESPGEPYAAEPETNAVPTVPSILADAAVPATPGTLPIWPREASLMTRELEGLMGRFESALLLAESTAPLVNAQDRDSVLVAAAEQVPIAEQDDPTTMIAQGYSIIERVQRTLDEFPVLIARQDYETARRSWFEARRLLWDNFPSDRPVVQPEIRAIWLDRGTIVSAGSHDGLKQLFDQFTRAGINTIFFETVNAGYPVYPSDIAPQQNPLIAKGWDPLASAVELAHARDMELHAWVWTFAAGNQRHNTLVDQPWGYLGPVLEQHPNWANTDHQGNPIPQGQTKPFFDPANPDVRRYLLELFDEILTQYDVDGLQLDYIRYPFQDPSAGRSYGYGTASRQAFRSLTGVDPATISPSDRALWQQWTDFRIEQIDSFVAAVSNLVQRRRPEAVLSAAVFPMPEHERRHKIQQVWERWARQGDVDIIATMSYAIDTPELESLVNPWLHNDLSPALILPAIRLLNLPNTLALDQIQALRDLPAGGYALFAAENLHQNPSLQQVFQRTQGSTDATLIPYREPFKAALARYEMLQREWDVAINSGRLYVSSQQREQLTQQAIALKTDLETLAEEPSPEHLRHAKRQLQRFRQEFNQLMTLYSIHGRYRVQTWDNRLAVIDSLLAYGEERL